MDVSVCQACDGGGCTACGGNGVVLEGPASPPTRDPLTQAELEKLEYGERLASVYLQDSAGLLSSAKLEPDWLVPGAIPRSGVTFVKGKPGAAKSWVVYDLAIALAQQRDWLGFGVPQPLSAASNSGAFVLNFDNPHSECGRRFKRLGLRPEDPLWVHSFGAHTPPEPLPTILQLPDAFEPLEAMVYARRPSLIAIDSLRQAHTSDESSSQEMALIMSQAKRFAMHGAAVVIIHHTRKSDGAMRGSTEIEATADAIIDVEKEDAAVSTISWGKTRGWNMAESTLTIRLEDQGDLTILKGGTPLSVLLATGPLKRTEIATALQLSQLQAKKIIDRALETGFVNELRLPDGSRTIALATARS